MFYVDTKKRSTTTTTTTQKNQFSSLERQWARIRERSYGCMTSTGSERLVQTDAIEGASHNVVCQQHWKTVNGDFFFEKVVWKRVLLYTAFTHCAGAGFDIWLFLLYFNSGAISVLVTFDSALFLYHGF